MFGGGGLNPRKMQKMMEQMGIEMEELDVESVTIALTDGSQLVFDEADVTKMEARGQSTYQVVGDPRTADDSATESTDIEIEDEPDSSAIPEADIELVVERTSADEAAAREALEAEDGDIAAAINRLS